MRGWHMRISEILCDSLLRNTRMQGSIVVTQSIVYLRRGELATGSCDKADSVVWQLVAGKTCSTRQQEQSIDCQDFSQKLARRDFPVKVPWWNLPITLHYTAIFSWVWLRAYLINIACTDLYRNENWTRARALICAYVYVYARISANRSTARFDLIESLRYHATRYRSWQSAAAISRLKLCYQLHKCRYCF